MPFVEIRMEITPADPGTEIAIAELAEIGFDSFEETGSGVCAYIRSEDFSETELKKLNLFSLPGFSASYSIHTLEDENWNKVWESGYDPVVINDQVYIRASFHPDMPEATYTIHIDPKMSFGTAHHETTAQMIAQMLEEDFRGKEVLDMGCGTAVLAILAEQMGAARVLGIDNDEHAFRNGLENLRKNNCRVSSVLLGDSDAVEGTFDTILANINKNILVKDMGVYAEHTRKNGIILFSGFYEFDFNELQKSAEEHGLLFDKKTSKNNWVMARFVKL